MVLPDQLLDDSLALVSEYFVLPPIFIARRPRRRRRHRPVLSCRIDRIIWEILAKFRVFFSVFNPRSALATRVMDRFAVLEVTALSVPSTFAVYRAEKSSRRVCHGGTADERKEKGPCSK